MDQDLDAPVHGKDVEGELQLILPFAKARFSCCFAKTFRSIFDVFFGVFCVFQRFFLYNEIPF